MAFVGFMIVLNILLIINSRVITADGIGTFKTTHVGPKSLWNDTHLDRLKKDLLQNYDRFVRPEHSANATQLKISLRILHLETDEAKSIIMVDSWLALEWTDSKLRWDEKNYEGLSQIRIADHEVWQPDIFLYNSVGGGEQLPRAAGKNVVVFSKGEVLWVPSIKLTALCDFNMRYWPFDRQNCYLKFGSWTHSANEIKFQNSTEVEIEDTAIASLWQIETTCEVTEKKYACCDELYESATYYLNITRKSTPYTAMIVTPAFVSTFLLLMQFWLPPHAEEKVILNGCVALVLNMFLLYFNHQTYMAGSETPLIVQFYSNSLYIVAFTTLSSVLTYWLCQMGNPKPLSGCFRGFMLRWAKWLLVEPYRYDNPYEERGQLEETDENTDKEHILTDLIRDERAVLATCIDRLLFVVCILSFIIMAMCLS